MKVKIKFENIKKIDKELKELGGKKVRIGFPSKVAEYAAYNEYGTRNIPARPFFRTALIYGEGKEKVINYAKDRITEITQNKNHMQVLNSIGLYCKGRVVSSIKYGGWKPNAPSTIKRKGNKPPLIDSGKMISSVEFEVLKK